MSKKKKNTHTPCSNKFHNLWSHPYKHSGECHRSSYSYCKLIKMWCPLSSHLSNQTWRLFTVFQEWWLNPEDFYAELCGANTIHILNLKTQNPWAAESVWDRQHEATAATCFMLSLLWVRCSSEADYIFDNNIARHYALLLSSCSLTGKTTHDLETNNWSPHIDMPSSISHWKRIRTR